MTRYAAFLRGVMPSNCTMPSLKKAFERTGFTDVRTVLASGNVVFTARASSEQALQHRIEAAMMAHLGRSFLTIVRSVDALREILAAEPYAAARLTPDAKRVVTFLREPCTTMLELPIELHGARIVAVKDREAFSAYVRTPKGPVFMSLIEKTFGKEQTTRTWETVEKVARL
jgi:uncharacterized protein (DUF1697 family)